MNDGPPHQPDPWEDDDWENDCQPAPFEGLHVDEPDSGEPLPRLLDCWRCGKQVEDNRTTCSFCRAPLRRQPSKDLELVNDVPAQAPSPVIKVIWIFALFLATSVVFGLILHVRFPKGEALDAKDIELLLHLTLAVEMLDTLLVVAAVLWIKRPPRPKSLSIEARIGAWAAGSPVLVAMLGLNFAYHYLLLAYLGAPEAKDALVEQFKLSGWLWLAMCIQPAVVEELFFRYLALCWLRTVTGTHSAVLISSVMFGIAHIYAPLSIPMLMALGLALGYLRVASGSLLLPMLVHFAHNAFILLWEVYR
jgi:membrane protease YdiL (CAAX protease family)